MKYPTSLRYLAAKAWELDGEVKRLRRHLAAEMQRSFDGQPPSVVEVGCGFGTNADACPGQYLGLELDRGMVRVARRRFSGRRGVRFARVDAARYMGGPFDTGLLCLALHEADDRGGVLRNLTTIVQRRLVIYDFDPHLRGINRWRVARAETGEMDHYWGFDAAAVLAPHGFWLDRQQPVSSRLRFWRFLRAESSR